MIIIIIIVMIIRFYDLQLGLKYSSQFLFEKAAKVHHMLAIQYFKINSPQGAFSVIVPRKQRSDSGMRLFMVRYKNIAT